MLVNAKEINYCVGKFDKSQNTLVVVSSVMDLFVLLYLWCIVVLESVLKCIFVFE